ncbi:MAG: DUF935 family protein [Bacteroidota bacterium]
MSIRKRVTNFFKSKFSRSHIPVSDRYQGAVIVNKIDVRPIHRQNQDIRKWRNALSSAEGIGQQRKLLYDLYSDIILDGFLLSCMEKRISAITNRQLTFTTDGVKNEQLTALTETSFFEDLLTHIVDSIFYGHSLCELNWPAPEGDIRRGWTKIVDRRHVKPRYGIVCQEPYDINGIKYREAPFESVTIECGKDESLGLLLQASQYVIYKRGNFGDWAEYTEVFGMPFRVGYYNDPKHREALIQALDQMGSAGHAAMPDGTRFDFFNGNNTGQGAEVFRQLRNALNEEISITILGNTMTTTESRRSGYAQAKVHQNVQNELHRSDQQFVLRLLNEQLTPYLESIGYKGLKGGKWSFVEEDFIDPKERIKIDVAINDKVPIPVSYWYDKYKIPRPTADDPAIEPQLDQEEDVPKTDPKKKASTTLKLSQFDAITALYAKQCEIHLSDPFDNRIRKIASSTERAFIERIRNGGSNKIDAIMYREYYGRLRRFAQFGYGKDLFDASDFDEAKIILSIKRNLSHFAGAKTKVITDLIKPLTRLRKSEYEKQALALLRRHHRNYLDVEIRTARKAADSAARWREFQQRKYLYPNLKYRTVGDDRVRDEHRVLHDIVRPVDHPFWDTHMPPNGWACRCSVIQTDEPVNDIEADIEILDIFKNNPGKTGQVFPDAHPYFSMSSAQLQRIFIVSEQLRAQMELNEVRRRIKVLDGKKVKLSSSDIEVQLNKRGLDNAIKSGHKEAALKNDLIAILQLITAFARPVKQGVKSYYAIEFLGVDFYLEINKVGNQYLLTNIVESI